MMLNRCCLQGFRTMRASFPCLLVCSEEHFMSALSEFKVMFFESHVSNREGARCEALHTASQLQTVLYTCLEAAAGAASLEVWLLSTNPISLRPKTRNEP